jgi:hypothetical protein
MVDVAEAQRRDRLAAVERHRQIAQLEGARPALARRAATPLGRALIYLGASLLRYSRADDPSVTKAYRASPRSIGLN